MLITDYLFENVKPIWDAYLEHDFIMDMGNGNLCKDKFKDYLIQDYLYLKEYAKVYAMALVKCENIEQMKFCQNSINGILEDESATHIWYLKNFGEKIEELEDYKIKEANENYTSYMKSIALTGDLLDTMVSVLPCAWSYYYIDYFGLATISDLPDLPMDNANETDEQELFTSIYKENLEDNFYKSWIESYSCEGYEQVARTSIEFVNTLSENIDENKKEKLKDIFIKASIHEMKFWDMAYEEVK